MRAERAWLVLGGLFGVLIVIAGYFVLISPEIGKANSRRAETDTIQVSNDQLQRQVNTLAEQNTSITKYLHDLQTLQSELPATADRPAFLRELEQAAINTGVSLANTTFGDPTPVTGTGAGTGGTGSGLYFVDVTVTANGSAENLQNYVDALQKTGDRAVLILTTNIKGTASDKSLVSGATLTLTAKIFLAFTAGKVS